MIEPMDKARTAEGGETGALLPCPFCGGGETQLQDNTIWNGGLRPDTLVSVTLRHWCVRAQGELPKYIEFREKTQDAVIAKWNTRVPSPTA